MQLVKSLFIAAGLLFTGHIAFSQSIPLIKANSEKIVIKDGDNPPSRYWDHLSIKVRPVVYHINKANQSRTVVFYTDIDSIAFKVAPGNQYNFKVLLRGRDTCYAQLSTVFQSPISNNAYGKSNHSDTIPFILGPDQYIHIKGSINSSQELDFIFDTGASYFVLTEKGLRKSTVVLDGFTENMGVGGLSTEKTSSRNNLQLGKLHWKGLPLLFYDYKGSLHADGIVGFNIFENKIVEIDYDKGLLILHQKLPATISGYSRLPTKHGVDGTFVECTLLKGSEIGRGWFLFDTGGSLAVAISGDFAEKYGLRRHLQVTGRSEVKGTGSNVNKAETAVLPGLSLAGFVVPNVPVQLNVGSSGYYESAGIMGNAVLKRFNTLIDYQNGIIYIKPNHLLNAPFAELAWGKIFSISAIGFSILGIGIFFHLKRRRLRRIASPGFKN
ncbi:pepsin/retropepsin-like aspartic protease family protein [Taibaiella koreensis]|uniref:pepsin/retropepsin-like aspartic protease family protein n=1 Tax=Taibaiella koreensis TaxID=1268548 RepID=UPI000E59BF57|nr:pepsin/retropepsin-like aspartic protease family protein [Taibaiella koreensis]